VITSLADGQPSGRCCLGDAVSSPGSCRSVAVDTSTVDPETGAR
jgi:hypothetical protein